MMVSLEGRFCGLAKQRLTAQIELENMGKEVVWLWDNCTGLEIMEDLDRLVEWQDLQCIVWAWTALGNFNSKGARNI